jgi:hypothetical protein
LLGIELIAICGDEEEVVMSDTQTMEVAADLGLMSGPHECVLAVDTAARSRPATFRITYKQPSLRKDYFDVRVRNTAGGYVVAVRDEGEQRFHKQSPRSAEELLSYFTNREKIVRTA